MAEENLIFIETCLENETSIVTYRWISLSLAINCQQAQSLLQEYLERYRQTNKVSRLYAIYFISGWISTGRIQISLVRETDLESAKSELDSILSFHIYSLSNTDTTNPRSLQSADSSINSEELTTLSQKGAIYNTRVLTSQLIYKHDVYINPNSNSTSKKIPSKPNNSNLEIVNNNNREIVNNNSSNKMTIQNSKSKLMANSNSNLNNAKLNFKTATETNPKFTNDKPDNELISEAPKVFLNATNISGVKRLSASNKVVRKGKSAAKFNSNQKKINFTTKINSSIDKIDKNMKKIDIEPVLTTQTNKPLDNPQSSSESSSSKSDIEIPQLKRYINPPKKTSPKISTDMIKISKNLKTGFVESDSEEEIQNFEEIAKEADIDEPVDPKAGRVKVIGNDKPIARGRKRVQRLVSVQSMDDDGYLITKKHHEIVTTDESERSANEDDSKNKHLTNNSQHRQTSQNSLSAYFIKK